MQKTANLGPRMPVVMGPIQSDAVVNLYGALCHQSKATLRT